MTEEFEYAVYNALGHFRYRARSLAEAHQAIQDEREGFETKPKRVIFRRRKAGPWEMVNWNDS